MPAYAPLSPLTNDPLAIVLLATPGAHGADEWDQCEAFWNSQLAALPEGSCLIPARGDAAGEGVLLAQALARSLKPEYWWFQHRLHIFSKT
ncbi:MAG: hypothetical protein EBS30_14290 [Planctomycetes bacterium]|nr:hypothetical protein [Planctomycetota bacterium]